jgi:hypothetical protein
MDRCLRPLTAWGDYKRGGRISEECGRRLGVEKVIEYRCGTAVRADLMTGGNGLTVAA